MYLNMMICYAGLCIFLRYLYIWVQSLVTYVRLHNKYILMYILYANKCILANIYRYAVNDCFAFDFNVHI